LKLVKVDWIPGFPKDKPTVIWKKYENQEIKKHPTAISSRASTKFVREELVKIPNGSNMLLAVLKEHVVSYVENQSRFVQLLMTHLLWRKKQNDDYKNNKNMRWQRRKRKRKRRKRHQQQPRH
jgi:hypothetical protein